MGQCTAGRWALWICFACPNRMPTTREAALTNNPKQNSWNDMLRSCWDHVGVMLGYPHSPMLGPPPHVHVHLHFTKFVSRIRWTGWTKSKVPTYTARKTLFYIWLSHLSYYFVSAEASPTATSIETRRAIPFRHTLILPSPWMIRFLFPTEKNTTNMFFIKREKQREHTK